MKGRFDKSIWIVPLAIAGLVAVFGWWGNTRLRQTVESQLTAELTATLRANVTALDVWTTNQAKLATALAEESKVKELALRIFERFHQVEGDNQRLIDIPEVQEIDNYLRPKLSKVGYGIANLVSTNLFVVASSMRGRMRPTTQVTEEHVAKFTELFSSGQPIIITPFKPRRPQGPPGGRRVGAGPGDFGSRGDRPRSARGERGPNDGAMRDRTPPPDGGRGPRGDITLMQVAAPIRDENGSVRGALALIINPDAEFTRILSVARSGQSGETYAFDQQGLMISRSRFDDQLKKFGLIDDRPGASSALNLRLGDPGGDLMKGFKPADTNLAARPLTRIVANAVAGGSGVDAVPSRDYRGTAVVGAWQWLPQHGFGVATQIDAGEAYQSLRVLKLLFILLFLLLVLCATGMFLFSYLNFVGRRRLSEAELKVKQLGQYALEEKIGEGGMGVVYRARHALMRRETAVKLLLPDRADPASIERFEREVCLTCQLTHPNTIQVYDYGHTPEGIFYYAMEFLRGVNLHDLVVRFGAQPEGRVIHILTQVCDSLAEAHGLGLVHRDVKPANVFLCDRGGVPDCVKVLDFGLVREFRGGKRETMSITGDKGMVGTPCFMPPESMKNSSKSDPRSDIYSVGALGYFLMTKEYVFNSESVLDLYEMHLTQTPIPPSRRSTNPISAELEETLLRCLEKEPNLRPQSVAELKALLLTSPRIAEWGPGERSAWWTRYHHEAIQFESGDGQKPTPIEATVKIDVAARLG